MESTVRESVREDNVVEIQESEASGELLIDWWDRAHKNKEIRWLSGYRGEVVWNRLDVRDLLAPKACVLEIGIGLGNSAADLKDKGCEVSALDISPIALERVSSFAKCYLPEQQLPPDTFDVALSHVVAQHMTDADLFAQIKAVVTSLKPTGVFAMQFADHASGFEQPHDESPVTLKMGEVCRSPKEMEKIVSDAGARLVKLIEREMWPDYGLRWYVVHLMK
jgi:2-polyprenyl-3-methyl-5-hydroxy-6-metoxy-1,4-benzoquinol methylase